MKSYGYLNNAKGAVAPLVAIMLVVIIACVAVVVDLGHIHNVKIQLQRAVDAAALAGANQLNGSPGAVQAAKDEAEAVAAANQVDQESVVIVAGDLIPGDPNGSHYIEVGTWDDEALGSPASTRFVATETSPNAVKVTATRTVDHVFFFFLPGSDVTADAIAVAKPLVPILPLAVVTCIPAEEMLENPGNLPTMNVCGIAAYRFDPDPEDSSAWTSLTFGANATDIRDYMETDEGAAKFNKVIFGKELNNDGLENQAVAPVPSSFASLYEGCPDYTTPFPNEFNIPCGLGKIADKDLAPQGDFPVPTSTPPGILNTTHGQPAPSGFDPLTGYGSPRTDAPNGALPRWYNLSDDDSFEGDDHFTRVWSQDRILLPWGSDLDSDGNLLQTSPYFDRLRDLADESSPGHYKPYGDDRFLLDNFIIEPSGPLATNLNAALGYTPPYWPDFLEVMKHAGYPKVGVINGNAVTVIQAFVANEMVTDGTNLKCSDNDPFPAGETTLRVNAPVIFAGACEDWDAVANASSQHELRYIGMSKLLLTRVWTTSSGDYDCGEDSEVVQLDTVGLPPGEDCTASDFDPGLRSSIYFSLPAASPPAAPSLLAIEGLTLVPVADDEDDQGSLLKVYLVE
jgi:Flp pilus assembly protein TadG